MKHEVLSKEKWVVLSAETLFHRIRPRDFASVKQLKFAHFSSSVLLTKSTHVELSLAALVMIFRQSFQPPESEHMSGKRSFTDHKGVQPETDPD